MKKLTVILSLAGIIATMALPASALDFSVEAPNGLEMAQATSIEPSVTADRGEQPNENLSKDNPLIAPVFGGPTSYLPNSGENLVPFLNGALRNSGAVIDGNGTVTLPTGQSLNTTMPSPIVTITQSKPEVPIAEERYTTVTSDLYYGSGSSKYLGTLKIPTLDVNVRVYQGTDSSALAKGAGHFTDTSIWDGNVCIAGHNRGTNCYFGDIHTLAFGDKISFSTRLGTRTYKVVSVQKVKETDSSMLSRTEDNVLTLFTCVRNQSSYRWCVRAEEI